MLREVLRLQWQATRWLLLPFLLLAFGAPLLVLRLATELRDDGVLNANLLLYQVEALAGVFPLLAALTGFAVALGCWSWDHRAGHVYALTLPVSRAQYVTARFFAGALILLLPMTALLAGGALGALTVELPEGLHAYPGALSLRFLLACGITYALGFALAAGTVRTTLALTVGAIVIVVFGTIGVEWLESALDIALVTPLDLIEAALLDWPGPFHVFGGSWMLVDV